MKHFLIILGLFCGSVGAAERLVAVDGVAEIVVAADIIRLQFSVARTNKTDPAAAKRQVDEVSASAIRSLVGLGLSESDITSDVLSIETAERYDSNDNAIPVGHLVSRQVKVTVRNVALYNKVIQALVDAGVSEVSDVTPDVSNIEEHRKAALAKAVAAGRERAEFLSQALGAKVKRVHQIGKSFSRSEDAFEDIVVTAQKRKETSKELPYEFQPGNVTVRASVQLEFEIE